MIKDSFFHSCFTSSRVEELYRFLNSWVPQLYGELDEEAIKTRGFELIQHDTEWMNNRTSSKVSFKSIFSQFLIAIFFLFIIKGWSWLWWRNWRVHTRIMGGELTILIILNSNLAKNNNFCDKMTKNISKGVFSIFFFIVSLIFTPLYIYMP